jgi:TrmH family RNA methyltransferase
MGITPHAITAKENPAVKLYRRLAKSRKARGQAGQFVLEGCRLVADAMQHGAHMTHLFLTQEAADRYGDTMLPLVPAGCTVLLLSEELSRYMAETEHPQGVFAICNLPEQAAWDDFLRQGRCYAVLHRLQDPGNAGMILRTADALGIAGVIFCESCDVYSPKVVRATMGSLFRVPVLVAGDPAQVFSAFAQHHVESCAAVVQGQAEQVGQCAYPAEKCAIWIGNEGNGLPEDVVQRCERRLTIPMQGTIESLNAAMAAGILMWEMTK